MSRITCQISIPIIIAWCCLCVLITNCDGNLLAGSSGEPQMPGHGSVKMEKSQPTDGAEIPKIDLDKKKSVETNSDSVKAGSEAGLGLNQGDNKPNDVKHITSKNPGNSETNHMTNSDSTTKPAFSGLPQPINLGALQRGIYVFLGLSIIVVAYIIFRCTRLSKNRTQMVRKYGVLAHRQDVEMRPLPLDDEDEDDTTVFDASEVGVHHKRHERT